MPDQTYTDAPDVRGVIDLWLNVVPDDPFPQPVSDQLKVSAAATVLAPSPELVELVAEAIHEWNPLQGRTWDHSTDSEYGVTRRGQAAAVLAALKAHATGGGDR